MDKTDVKDPCILCGSNTNEMLFYKKKTGQKYFKCNNCDFIFLAPNFYLSSQEEFRHYQGHNNDIHDKAYQDFVMPLVDLIRQYTTSKQLGLDYGCGPGPVISHLLELDGYQLDKYDLFFLDDKEVFNKKYDFIVLSEVAEHFQKPLDSFSQLFNMLNKEGKIFVMTALTDGIKDFKSWHYHRDPSHVGFFCNRSFRWLSSKLAREVIYTDSYKCTVLT